MRRYFPVLLCAVFTAGNAAASTFPLPPPGVDLVGQVESVTASRKDTLLDIARRYDIGQDEIVLANPQDRNVFWASQTVMADALKLAGIPV